MGQAAAPLGGELVHGLLPWLRRVTALDWIIVVFTVLMALWGYAQGLIVGALSLGGFAAGAFVGSRLGPLLLAEGAESPVRAAVRPGRGAHGRRRPGLRPGARSASGCATAWATRSACSTASAAACWSPASGLGWSGSAAPSRSRPPARASCASRSSARRSCASSTRVLPPSGRILRAFARFDPFPQIDGPAGRRRGRPTSRIARDPQVRAAGAQRGQGARHRLRPRGAGQRLGGGRRRRRDQRPRRGGPGRHDRAAPRRGLPPRRRGDLVRLPQRPGDAARAGPGGAPAAAARARTPPRAPRRRSSASPRTAPTT